MKKTLTITSLIGASLLTAMAHAQTISAPQLTLFGGTPMPKDGVPPLGLPMPTISIHTINTLPKKIINSDGTMIDVAEIDYFIDKVNPAVRHYPPSFANRTDRHNTTQNIKYLLQFLTPHAQKKNASHEILYRAAQLHAMAKNLDMGAEHGVRAGEYLGRILAMHKDDDNANLLYGMILSESGGFKEGQKFLSIVKNSVESLQTQAQAALLNDDKARALALLHQAQAIATDAQKAQINEQITLINAGEYYIWKKSVLPLGISTAPSF